MNEETKNLLNIAKKLAGKQLITYEELQGFITDVANILAQYRSATSQINKETKDTLNTLIKAIDDTHTEILNKNIKKVEDYMDSAKGELASKAEPIIYSFTEEQKKEIRKLVSAQKKTLQDIVARTPKDGVDGKDGADGQRGEPGRDGKDGSPDSPEQVRDKLETLKEEERLDASAIKGLEKFMKTTKEVVSGGVRLLTGLVDVSISSPSNGQALVYDSSLQLWKNGTITGSGTGDVTGPASATDNAIARYDGTTGKLIQNSSVTIADTGEMVSSSDVEVSDNTKGFIIKSADGTRWRVGITNNGELTAVSL